MANIGLRNARYNKIDYTTNKYMALTGNKVPVLGKLIDSKLTEDRNDTSLFADDAEEEHDRSFKSANIALTFSDVEDNVYADVKGCLEDDGEVTENEDDEAPEIGYGHVITKIINGIKKYKVEFLPRIKVTKITGDVKTKGESLEFGTVSLEAKVMALKEDMNGLKKGDWKKVKTFESMKEAEEYLDNLLTPAA